MIGVDWLEFSVRGVDWQTAADRLTFDGEGWRELDHGALGHSNVAVSDRGIDVMWDERRPEVHVRLRGQACGSLAQATIVGLLPWVFEQDGHFSRIDVQATVPYSTATVEQFAEAIERGEHVTRARLAGLTRQIALDRSNPHRLLGRTLYVGAPTSRRRLRVYDKGVESRGEVQGTRIELQERDEAADECVRQLLTVVPMHVVFTGRLAGFLDFREPQAQNVTRRARADWYRVLIGEVERASAVAPSPEATPEEAAEWVRRQIAPTLAALRRLGMLDVGSLLDSGNRRLSRKHQGWLRARGLHGRALGVARSRVDGSSG